jgi:DNA polymerase-3 subunit beta
MKFTTTQNSTLKSLMLVLGGVAKSGESQMVKITANKDAKKITFKTRNIDIDIKSYFEANVDESGEVAVEFTKLIEVVKKLNSSIDVSFETKDLTLNIKSGKSKFALNGAKTQNIEEPTFKEGAKSTFRIMSKQLLSLIDKTKFSIFPDETRFNLNGVLLQFKEVNSKSYLTAVSTDGHRLSYAEIEASNKSGESLPKVIIPKKCTLELRKILDASQDEEIEVSLYEKQFSIFSPTMQFTSKLIDAEFPEYQKVIPKENTKIIKINRKDFIGLVERVATIHAGSSENSLTLTFSSDLLKIKGTNNNTGEATDEISTECKLEDAISINYNFVYLLEILSHIGSENLLFCLKDEKTPALIKDETLTSYFYILMPMRF